MFEKKTVHYNACEDSVISIEDRDREVSYDLYVDIAEPTPRLKIESDTYNPITLHLKQKDLNNLTKLSGYDIKLVLDDITEPLQLQTDNALDVVIESDGLDLERVLPLIEGSNIPLLVNDIDVYEKVMSIGYSGTLYITMGCFRDMTDTFEPTEEKPVGTLEQITIYTCFEADNFDIADNEGMCYSERFGIYADFDVLQQFSISTVESVLRKFNVVKKG